MKSGVSFAELRILSIKAFLVESDSVNEASKVAEAKLSSLFGTNK